MEFRIINDSHFKECFSDECYHRVLRELEKIKEWDKKEYLSVDYDDYGGIALFESVHTMHDNVEIISFVTTCK